MSNLQQWIQLKDWFETAMMIGVGIVYAVSKYFEYRKKKEVEHKQKQHTLDRNTEIDGLIYPILWELCMQFACMRVYLQQFHNGTKFYTGQSIQRKTVSHEVVGHRSIVKVKQNHDGVLISEMMHKILMELRLNGYYMVRKTDEVKLAFPDLYDWMNVYEVSSLLYVRLVDSKTRETVATLNFHFNHDNPLTDADLDEILQTKKRLESIFDKL
jgi:hypothetical protein